MVAPRVVAAVADQGFGVAGRLGFGVGCGKGCNKLCGKGAARASLRRGPRRGSRLMNCGGGRLAATGHGSGLAAKESHGTAVWPR